MRSVEAWIPASGAWKAMRHHFTSEAMYKHRPLDWTRPRNGRMPAQESELNNKNDMIKGGDAKPSKSISTATEGRHPCPRVTPLMIDMNSHLDMVPPRGRTRK